jgi:hypothetical protein
VCHFVVCAAQLEAENGLQVLALKHDVAFESVAEVGCMCERCLVDDLVDTRCKDESQVLPLLLGKIMVCQSVLRPTSGYPFGSRNASGITLLLSCDDSSDGLGFAVYSVSARPVCLGVLGDARPLGVVSGVVGRE